MAKKLARKEENELLKLENEMADQEMRKLNTQVVADEDGIVRDVPLLAGYIDEDGVLHDTFSFREMTGKDEEAISKNDIKTNSAKIINTLVERCVISIGSITKREAGAKWGQIIRNMLGGDLDYMAFKIRELSKGEEIEFNHKCGSCGTNLTTIVQTEEFNLKPFNGQREIPFSLERGYKDKVGVHKDGVLRMMNGFDREIVVPVFKKNVSTATTLLLTRLIKFDDGAVVTNNSVNEMSLKDRDYLQKIIKENSFGVDTNFELTCSNCGADLSGEVGESNFF